MNRIENENLFFSLHKFNNLKNVHFVTSPLLLRRRHGQAVIDLELHAHVVVLAVARLNRRLQVKTKPGVRVREGEPTADLGP